MIATLPDDEISKMVVGPMETTKFSVAPTMCSGCGQPIVIHAGTSYIKKGNMTYHNEECMTRCRFCP